MNKAEIEAVAAAVVIPDGATDLKMVVVHEQGERLPDGTWAGRGGHTQYGPAWMIRGGVETSPPVALFDKQRDAFALHDLITGPEGELWQRKERRRQRIADLDAAEAAAAAEAREMEREQWRLHGGAGSSRRSRSSATRTDTNGQLGSAIARLSRSRSRRTSSQQPSSS